MTAFAEMFDHLFANEDMTESAVYKLAPPSGELIPLRVVMRRDDVRTSSGDSSFQSSTTMIDVRSSDVASPKKGDQVLVGEQTFTVQGEPESSADGLLWQLNVKKA